MLYLAYAAEVCALIICAAALNNHGCPVMAWTMLMMAAFTTIKRTLDSPAKGQGK